MTFFQLSIITFACLTYTSGFSIHKCVTPTGLQGKCVLPQRCRTSPRDQFNTDLMSLCPNRKKICCLINENMDPTLDIDTRNHPVADQGNNISCITPDGEDGTCMTLNSCPHLADMLQDTAPITAREFVKSSKCIQNPDYVCCGPTDHLKQTTGTKEISCSSDLPLSSETRCCGIHGGISDRIVGGYVTSIGEYPWSVVIDYKINRNFEMSKMLCGGALISGRYVLTAAHCVVGDVIKYGIPSYVRLGAYNISTGDCDCLSSPADSKYCTPGTVVLPIESIIPHPEYNSSNPHRRHDIALLRLNQSAPYTDLIRPICLPTKDITAQPPPRFRLYVAGWGMDDTNTISDVKHHVDLPFVSQKECQQMYNHQNIDLWKGQLCAGGEFGKDSCKGDSGGPLMYQNEKQYEVIGVVSFGQTPCGQDMAGVYTKVYEYIPWIFSQMKS